MLRRESAIVILASSLLAGCILPYSIQIQLTPEPATPAPATETGRLPGASPTAEPSARPAATQAEAPAATQAEAPAASPAITPIPTQAATATTSPGVEAAAQPTAPVVRYALQPGSPGWLPNFTHPEVGCNWMGVAGQVFDSKQNPVSALVVEVGGALNGADLIRLSLTGIAPMYGPGGYEVVLANQAAETRGQLWIQVLDLVGRPLSDRYSFDTYADCNRNLVLINFVQSAAQVSILYLPLLHHEYLHVHTPTPEP